MPTLIFRDTNGSKHTYVLKEELSVGRDVSNDVVLKDPDVSKRHCRFFLDDDGGVWVEDLRSANGVVVDKRRIDEAVRIAPGAEILIGSCSVGLTGTAALAAPPKATRAMDVIDSEPPRPARPVLKPPVRKHAPKPTLHGVSGPFADLVIPLKKAKLLVGRIEPADVLLDDDSVSRRHAEIFKVGGSWMVRDLGSANGTWVNGIRLSEAMLSPGDALRFGIIELSYSGPGDASDRVRERNRMPLAIAGGITAGVLVLVVVASLLRPPEPPPPVPKVKVDDTAELDRQMGECAALADPERDGYDCAKALKVCTEIFTADAMYVKARQLARRCQKELDYEEVLKKASLLVATSREEEALEDLVRIADKDSTVFLRARAKFNEAAETLIRRNRNNCKIEVNAARFEDALKPCRRTLELTCNKPDGPDAQAQAWLQRALRQVRGKDEFNCPSEYAAYQKIVVDGPPPGPSVEQTIRSRYSSDKRLADYMVSYWKDGKAKQLSSTLKNIVSREPTKGPDFEEVTLQLDVIDGQYAKGQSALRRGQVKELEATWQPAFEAEAKLLPAGVQSALVKEMHEELAAALFKAAKTAQTQSHSPQAFEYLARCIEHDPRNTDCSLAIVQLDHEAGTHLEQESTCESYGYVLSITTARSAFHKRADELFKKAGCK